MKALCIILFVMEVFHNGIVDGTSPRLASNTVSNGKSSIGASSSFKKKVSSKNERRLKKGATKGKGKKTKNPSSSPSILPSLMPTVCPADGNNKAKFWNGELVEKSNGSFKPRTKTCQWLSNTDETTRNTLCSMKAGYWSKLPAREVCTGTCESCDLTKEPSIVPSSVPSIMPSVCVPEPTTAPTSTFVGPCKDNDGSIFGKKDQLTCEDLRIGTEEYRLRKCQRPKLAKKCPQTCGKCCEDDSAFKFFRRNDFKTCSWLQKKPDDRIEQICSREGDDVQMGCQVTCDNCFNNLGPIFYGIDSIYSENQGSATIIFDHPESVLDDCIQKSIVYDLFIAPVDYDLKAVLKNIESDIPELIKMFGTDSLLQHFSFTDLTGDNQIDLLSLNPGPHTFYMTAELNGEYSKNTALIEIVVSSENPKVKDDVNVVGIFVPSNNVNIALAPTGFEDSREPHELVFSGGPFPAITQNLKVGDIINGFDSLLFEPFTRRIESIVSSSSSSITFEVVATTFDDIYETYFFSADMSGNSRKEDAIESDGRRRLHSLEEITGCFVSCGNSSIVSDGVENTTDAAAILSSLAVDLGLQDYCVRPPNDISASTNTSTTSNATAVTGLRTAVSDTFSKATADIHSNTRITSYIAVDGGSSNASLSVDTTYDITTTYNQNNVGSGSGLPRRSLAHNTIHEDKWTDSYLNCDKRKVKNQILSRVNAGLPIPKTGWQECYRLYISQGIIDGRRLLSRDLSSVIGTAVISVSFSGSTSVGVKLSDNVLVQTFDEPTFVLEKVSAEFDGDIEIDATVGLDRELTASLFDGFLVASSTTSFKKQISAVIEVGEGEYNITTVVEKIMGGRNTTEVLNSTEYSASYGVGSGNSTSSPTASPTSVQTSSASPSLTPSDTPSATATPLPSDTPTSLPTEGPTSLSTEGPSEPPTEGPSDSPSEAPSLQCTAGCPFQSKSDLESTVADYCSNPAAWVAGYADFDFYGGIESWDTSLITDMSYLFMDELTCNPDISLWDVSQVTTFREMFRQASNFDQDISGWDVSSGLFFVAMFFQASSFNQDISSWNVENGKISSMFSYATSFNQDISTWDVSNIESFAEMFNGASTFNQDLSAWNVSSGTSFRFMFSQTPFDQDISGWQVSSGVDFEYMFRSASNFNQDISSWDVSSGTSFTNMLNGASSFNQDITGWDFSSAIPDSLENICTGVISCSSGGGV